MIQCEKYDEEVHMQICKYIVLRKA